MIVIDDLNKWTFERTIFICQRWSEDNASFEYNFMGLQVERKAILDCFSTTLPQPELRNVSQLWSKYLLATSALGYVSFSLFSMLYRPFLNPVALIAVEGCEASLSPFKCIVVSR